MSDIPEDYLMSLETALLALLAFIIVISILLAIIYSLPAIFKAINSFYSKNKMYKYYTAIILSILAIIFHKEINEFMLGGVAEILVIFTVFGLGITIFYFLFQGFLFNNFANPLRLSVKRGKYQSKNIEENTDLTDLKDKSKYSSFMKALKN